MPWPADTGTFLLFDAKYGARCVLTVVRSGQRFRDPPAGFLGSTHCCFQTAPEKISKENLNTNKLVANIPVIARDKLFVCPAKNALFHEYQKKHPLVFGAVVKAKCCFPDVVCGVLMITGLTCT